MAYFREQQLELLAGKDTGSSLIQSETTVNERTIPAENGSNIVIQQRKKVELEIKKVQPQMDFRSIDFCPGETIKLLYKLQLLPGVPFNVLKLEHPTIRNAKCLIATSQANFGDVIEGYEDVPSTVEKTVSNKWTKLLNSLIVTPDAKYIIATRCNMEEEKTFGDKKFAIMKYEFPKTMLKKYMQFCDDETVEINCDEPNFKYETVKKVIRESSDILSRSTYEIHRRNLEPVHRNY